MKAQRATLDTIEQNVLNTQSNVEAGAVNIRKALNHSIVSTAAGGAFIGLTIGGPIGFLAGQVYSFFIYGCSFF